MKLAVAALSLVVPGAGHALRARVWRGLAWLVVAAALAMTLTLTGPLGLLAALLVRVAAAIDAVVVRSGGPVPSSRVIGIILAMAGATVGMWVFMRLVMFEGHGGRRLRARCAGANSDARRSRKTNFSANVPAPSEEHKWRVH
ncbi:MAG: hypothetical protein IPL61_28385 [Myxococcales bacterium]|nr:hypothetical protein [Myxococcales bacterium]